MSAPVWPGARGAVVATLEWLIALVIVGVVLWVGSYVVVLVVRMVGGSL